MLGPVASLEDPPQGRFPSPPARGSPMRASLGVGLWPALGLGCRHFRARYHICPLDFMPSVLVVGTGTRAVVDTGGRTQFLPVSCS